MLVASLRQLRYQRARLLSTVAALPTDACNRLGCALTRGSSRGILKRVGYLIGDSEMTYKGHVRNGVVVLDEPVDLREGDEVSVEVTRRGPETEADAPTLYEQLKDVIGIAEGLPPDAALNHDHYLYGLPKRDGT